MRTAFAAYLTDVSDLDREVGVVRSSIERNGKADDTLFVFTVAHGAQLPFAQWALNDPGIPLPFIAACPGRVPAGRARHAMISLTRLLPTVLAAAGGRRPLGRDGTRLFTGVGGDGGS